MDRTYNQRTLPGNNRATQGSRAYYYYPQPEALPLLHNPHEVQHESPGFQSLHFLSPGSGRIGQHEDQWQTSSSNDTGYASQPASSANFSTPSNVIPYFPSSQDSPLTSSQFFVSPMEPSPHGNDNDPPQAQNPFIGDSGHFYPVPAPKSEPSGGSRTKKRRRNESLDAQNTSDRLLRPPKVPRQAGNHTHQVQTAPSPFARPAGTLSNAPAPDVHHNYGIQPQISPNSSRLEVTRQRGLSPPKLTEKSAKIVLSFLENRINKGLFPSPEEISALSTLTGGVPPQIISTWITEYHPGYSAYDPPTSSSVAFSQHRLTPSRPPEVDNVASSRPGPNNHLPRDVRQAIDKYVIACSKKRARLDGRRKVNKGQYACTVGCGYCTGRAFDWKRHEETHQPQEFWLCKPCRTGPSPKMVLFSRRDKMLPHIKADHPDENADEVVENSKQNYINDFKKLCGFCGHHFESWDSRNNHILQHFDGKLEGGARNITEWKDSWSEDESEGEGDDALDEDGSSDGSDEQDPDVPPAGASGGSSSGYGYGNQHPPTDQHQEGSPGDGEYQAGSGEYYEYGGWSSNYSLVDRPGSCRQHIPSELGPSSPHKASMHRTEGGHVLENSVITTPRTENDLHRSRVANIHTCVHPATLSIPHSRKQESNLSSSGHIGGIIGKGAYGSVDVVENRVTKQLYARKRCQVSPRNLSVQRSFHREARIMKLLDHPHIVSLVSAYAQDTSLNIVMSPLAQCTLRQYLDHQNMQQKHTPRIHSWFGCLSSALSYLHANRVRHADIKPQNLLIRDSDVFISDFGISRIVSEPDSTSSSISPMTPLYAAMEIAEHQPHGRKADIFSLGCVVVEMLTVSQGYTIAELHRHLGISISKKRPRSHQAYYKEHRGLLSWIDQLRSRATRSTQRLWDVCKCMLENEIEHRPSASMLVEHLYQLLRSETPGSLPECLSTSVKSRIQSIQPPVTSTPEAEPPLADHRPAKFYPQRPFTRNHNSKSPPCSSSFYISPPPSPPMMPFKEKAPHSTFKCGTTTCLTSFAPLSKTKATKGSGISPVKMANEAKAQATNTFKFYATIPTTVLCMPSDSGRVHFQISLLILPIALVTQSQESASLVDTHCVSSTANEARQHTLDRPQPLHSLLSNSSLPPRREGSRSETHKGGRVRLMNRKACHLCGQLFTAPRLTDCRQCGHNRCRDCPELRHEILEEKLPLDQDSVLTEIGSWQQLGPPAYSLADTSPLIEDQIVFDKIVGQNQIVGYPKEHFLEGSPSTFDLIQTPLQNCKDEWWRPKISSRDSPDPDPPRLLSEGSLCSSGQPVQKRMKHESYHIPGSDVDSTASVDLEGRRRISVRSQQTVNIKRRMDGQPENPNSNTNSHNIFSRIPSFRKANPAADVAEPSVKYLPRIFKSASTSTDGNNAVARLPIVQISHSVSCDDETPNHGGRICFLQRLNSHSQWTLDRPVSSHPHLEAGHSVTVAGSSASVRSTGSKEFRYYGRHANSWLFNNYSFTGGAKKMFRFLAGGKGVEGGK